MNNFVKLDRVLEGYSDLKWITISPKGSLVTACISIDEENELDDMVNRKTEYSFEFIDVTGIRVLKRDGILVPELNSQAPVSLQLVVALTESIFRNQPIYEWSVFEPAYQYSVGGKHSVDISINPASGTHEHRAVFFKESSSLSGPDFFWVIMIDFKNLKIKELEGNKVSILDFLNKYKKYIEENA